MEDAPEFCDPPWDAPLDEGATLRSIPARATIKGFFLLPLIETARTHGIDLGLPRDRYLAEGDYPVRDHARALHTLARALFRDVPIRKGLRRLGHPTVQTFEASTLGRMIWSNDHDIEGALVAVAKGYALSSSDARVSVVELDAHRARLRFRDVHWFLDSHHVGTFEGVFGSCGLRAQIRVRLDGPHAGEFLCTW